MGLTKLWPVYNFFACCREGLCVCVRERERERERERGGER